MHGPACVFSSSLSVGMTCCRWGMLRLSLQYVYECASSSQRDACYNEEMSVITSYHQVYLELITDTLQADIATTN